MNILEQEYLTAKDLQNIIPGISYEKSLEIINEVQEEMKQKNYFIPKTKSKVALTKMIRKKLGL